MCERFNKLPSEVLAEPADELLRMTTIAALQQPVEE